MEIVNILRQTRTAAPATYQTQGGIVCIERKKKSFASIVLVYDEVEYASSRE